MTRHLLAIEIGPVIEFISAARRTRDLWFGSYVLSELAKAAARAIAQQCGGPQALIFPAPQDANALQPGSPLCVADVLLAETPEGTEPADVARFAGQELRRHWADYATAAFKVAEPWIRQEIWDSQVGDVMEHYAAWVVLPSEQDYASTRRQLMQLLAGRTACRDFQAASGQWRVPKSSLDGARDSVFRELSDQQWAHCRRRVRLQAGEHLDAVGLTKRLAQPLNRDDDDTFRPTYPSTSRIAVDPYIRGLQRAAEQDSQVAEKWQAVKSACRSLVQSHILSRVDDVVYPQYGEFPFEGTALFPTRLMDLAEEAGLPIAAGRDLPEPMRPLRDALRRLQSDGRWRFGEPDPYLAVVVADGDRVGKALERLSDAGQHRRFSQSLDQFARGVREIVQQHQGALVFAGGDDVLAFVPVDRVLSCARALYDRFDESLREACGRDSVPTLSVGVAIGHLLEPLEDLVQWARQAEQVAKDGRDGYDQERNALAIRLQPRGGAPILLRHSWRPKDDPTSPDARLAGWVDLLRNNQLPDKAAYDVRRLADVYRDWEDPAAATDALVSDVQRTLKRKRTADSGGQRELGLRRIESLVQPLRELGGAESGRCAHAVVRLAEEIIVARRLAVSLAQTEPSR